MAGDNSRLIRLDFFRPYGRVGWRVDGKKVAAFESIKNRAVLSLVPLNQGQSLSVFSIGWLPRGWPHSVPAPVDLGNESVVEFCDHMLQVLESVERNQRDGVSLTDCHKDDISAISKICEAKQIPNVFEDLILKGREVLTLEVRIGLLKLKELVLQKAEPPNRQLDDGIDGQNAVADSQCIGNEDSRITSANNAGSIADDTGAQSSCANANVESAVCEASEPVAAKLQPKKIDRWPDALACLTGQEIVLVEAMRETAAGLSYSEMIDVDGAFDSLAIPSNARTRVKRIRDSWKEHNIPFEIPKARRCGKLRVVKTISEKNVSDT